MKDGQYLNLHAAHLRLLTTVLLAVVLNSPYMFVLSALRRPQFRPRRLGTLLFSLSQLTSITVGQARCPLAMRASLSECVVIPYLISVLRRSLACILGRIISIDIFISNNHQEVICVCSHIRQALQQLRVQEFKWCQSAAWASCPY